MNVRKALHVEAAGAIEQTSSENARTRCRIYSLSVILSVGSINSYNEMMGGGGIPRRAI